MTGAFAVAEYSQISAGAKQSADVVAPMILDRMVRTVGQPVTVVDVGCGEGWWARAFGALGCDVVGIDGSDWPAGHPLGDRFFHHDLTSPLPRIGKFALAVCLEVAEHLPESHAAEFVAELCSMADVVVFSAAIPWQTGAGHVNLQWQSWWARIFAAHGFAPNVGLRDEIWDDDRVEAWYRQNLVVYAPPELQEDDNTGPLDVVHPVIHAWGRS